MRVRSNLNNHPWWVASSLVLVALLAALTGCDRETDRPLNVYLITLDTARDADTKERAAAALDRIVVVE